MTNTIRLNHKNLHLALQTHMRMMLLDIGVKKGKKKEKLFRKMLLNFSEGTKTYTDFNRIVIGLNDPLLTGDINEQFHKAKVLLSHEVGHNHFTNAKTWRSFCYSANRIFGSLIGNFAKDVLAIYEDSRSDYLMTLLHPHLKDAFLALHKNDLLNYDRESNDVLKEEPIDSLTKLTIIRNGLFFMSRMHTIPLIENKEIMNYLEECFPYIMYVRTAQTTLDAVHATHRTMEILQPVLDEFISDSPERIEAIFHQMNSIGTEEPSFYDDLEGITESTEEEDDDLFSELLEAISEEFEERYEYEEESEDFEEIDEIEEDEEFDDHEEDEDEDEDEDEEFEEEEEEEEEEFDDVDEKEYESVYDMSDDFVDPTHEEEAEEIKKKSSQPIKQDLMNIFAKRYYFVEDVKELKAASLQNQTKKFKDPINKNVLKNYLDSTIKEESDFYQTLEHKRFANLKPKIHSSLHTGCMPYFIPKEKMECFTPNEYAELFKPIQPIVRQTVSQLKDLISYAEDSVNYHQTSGDIHSNQLVDYLALHKQDIFKTKEIELKQLQIEGMFVFDSSGSNTATIRNRKNDQVIQRYMMNQTIAILLHEVFKQMKFPHSAWHFYEEYERPTNQIFAPMIDRSNCFKKQTGLLLKDINAYENNRDGFSLRYAGEYLNRFSTCENRLLIVISDGIPAANDYYGEKAIQDTKQAVLEIEKRGTKVIGIFTGHEGENKSFSTMYENAIFCNNENIFELPKILKNVLIEEFENRLKNII